MNLSRIEEPEFHTYTNCFSQHANGLYSSQSLKTIQVVYNVIQPSVQTSENKSFHLFTVETQHGPEMFCEPKAKKRAKGQSL